MISRRTLFGLLAAAPVAVKFSDLPGPRLQDMRAAIVRITEAACGEAPTHVVIDAKTWASLAAEMGAPESITVLGVPVSGDPFCPDDYCYGLHDSDAAIPALKTTFSDPAITIAEPVRRFSAG